MTFYALVFCRKHCDSQFNCLFISQRTWTHWRRWLPVCLPMLRTRTSQLQCGWNIRTDLNSCRWRATLCLSRICATLISTFLSQTCMSTTSLGWEFEVVNQLPSFVKKLYGSGPTTTIYKRLTEFNVDKHMGIFHT